jgi:hypothetical protein
MVFVSFRRAVQGGLIAPFPRDVGIGADPNPDQGDYHRGNLAGLEGISSPLKVHRRSGPQAQTVNDQERETEDAVIESHPDEAVTLTEEEYRKAEADDDTEPVRPAVLARMPVTRQVEQIDGNELRAPMARPRLGKCRWLVQETRERVGPDQDEYSNEDVKNNADKQQPSIKLEFFGLGLAQALSLNHYV